MKITMRDGVQQQLLDLSTMRLRPKALVQHAMRFHVYDPARGVAVEKFSTTDRALQREIIKKYVLNFGAVFRASSWINVKTRRQELWPVENFAGMNLRRMAERDLQRHWGSRVKLTGISVRDIMYFSDGQISSTPDAIGMYENHPLVYKGRAVGTIFTIDGADVMNNARNVAYWLPKPWWDGFHSGYRKVPKEFPGGCAFVCSNWCQRYSHQNYDGGGIWIASMTQGQTLGGWSLTTMLNKGVVSTEDIIRVHPKNRHVTEQALVDRMDLIAASQKLSRGRVGTVCIECGKELTSPYGICTCGISNTTYYLGQNYGRFCSVCGNGSFGCVCGSRDYITMRPIDHERHFEGLKRSLAEIKVGGVKDAELPF